MKKVGQFKGDRDGWIYHVYDGFFYRNNTTRVNLMYLQCLNKGCPGRASMPTNPEDRILNNFKMTGLHDHPPNFHRIGVLNLRRKLKARCESELTPIKQIYEEEIAKVPAGVAALISYPKYRTTMHRCRNLVQKAIMSSLHEDSECVEISEVEYAEDPEAEDETAEPADHEDQNFVAVESERKRARTKSSSQPLLESKVKKTKLIEQDEAEESSFFEEVEQADDTYEEENDDEDAYDDQIEVNQEDLSEYFKFYKTKPTYRKKTCDDLLSTFFNEMERTVRSFLPSVIIEAKGRIANLINKLEMKNWQVQQLLEEKQQEELTPFSVQKQEQRKLSRRLKEQQRQLIEHEQQQEEILQETQKLRQYKVHIINIKKQEPVSEEYQVVDEEHQETDEQGELVHEEGELVHEEGELVHEPGELVHEQGELVHEQGALVYEQGALVYEQVQLTQEENQPVYEQDEESKVFIGLP